MTYTKKMHDAIKRDIKDGKDTIVTDLLKEIERLQERETRLVTEIDRLNTFMKWKEEMQDEEHW